MQQDRYGIDSLRSPPVKEGNTYRVKIESTGREGDGIAKIEGFVVFVPGAKVGEELDVRINKVTRRVGFGERVGELEPEEIQETEEIPETEEASETEELQESEEAPEPEELENIKDSED
ncbi:MAG: TRAM domain-containing protein [Methanomassiliicoccales archaeon]|nr:MAG: TRAM domain-containing protein [Methanomassiliicoccales archaeon]